MGHRPGRAMGLRAVACVAAIALLAAACGDDDSGDQAATEPVTASITVLADEAIALTGGVPEASVAILAAADGGAGYDAIAASILDGTLVSEEPDEEAAPRGSGTPTVELVAIPGRRERGPDRV